MFKLVDKNADELTGALGLTEEEFSILVKKCAELTAKDYDSVSERIIDLQNEDIGVLAFMASREIEMAKKYITIENLINNCSEELD